MQKARRHCQKAAPTACRRMVSGSVALPCSGFFSPFPHGTGPLSVSYEYLALPDGPGGFTQDRVFSLAGWSRRIHAGFLVPRATQDTATLHVASCTRLSRSAEELSRTFHSRHFLRPRGPTTPTGPEPCRFGLFPVRSPLLGESLTCFLFLRVLRCFSSPGWPRIAVAGLQPAGLSHSEIRGSRVICTSPRLFAAYHVLHRL